MTDITKNMERILIITLMIFSIIMCQSYTSEKRYNNNYDDRIDIPMWRKRKIRQANKILEELIKNKENKKLHLENEIVSCNYNDVFSDKLCLGDIFPDKFEYKYICGYY